MDLKLMYITNRPDVAAIAENAGVDWVFVDMEYIGKDARQAGLNSVKNHHTVEDVRNLRRSLSRAKLLVRVNPIHPATEDCCSSEEEIEQVIQSGADILMLPFFKTVDEVRLFLDCIKGRAVALLLLETPEAVEVLDEILALPGIDGIHIGLNDLSLGYHRTFMFELLADGTVETLCRKIGAAGIPFGFGGIASLGEGMLPAEMILKEHVRLGSSMVILSRSFCNVTEESDLEWVREKFDVGVKQLRDYQRQIEREGCSFEENQAMIRQRVQMVIDKILRSRAEAQRA